MSEAGLEQKYIQEAFDTNWVVPLGPNVNGLEDDLRKYVGQDKEVVALSSGTAAVHLSLIACGVQPGDEVIVQSFTFCASSHPITYLGATPVFVDSEKETWNMDPVLLEEAIKDRIAKTGKKPKAIIPVALYGMPYQIERIMDVAKRYEIPVIEDAAEGFGSRYNGQVLGTFGDFGILSFNGNKMITTSGGGALICHTKEDADRVKFFATQAREPYPYYQNKYIGYNYLLSNVSAGIGRGQMLVVDDHINHRRHIHRLYKELLADVPGITVKEPIADAAVEPNYWLSCILVDPQQTGFTYSDLQQRLAEGNVESRPIWKPMHLQPVFQGAPSYVNGVSEQIFSRGLCLPSGPMVSDENIVYITDLIKRH
jgi:dTDP-4-amino-4,6-dideoxygalactose transaminase